MPVCFVAGRSDWGIYQKPGAIHDMEIVVYRDFQCLHLLDGVGHWVQQAQADEVGRLLTVFLAYNRQA